jgi:hypothetical protein
VQRGEGDGGKKLAGEMQGDRRGQREKRTKRGKGIEEEKSVNSKYLREI